MGQFETPRTTEFCLFLSMSERGLWGSRRSQEPTRAVFGDMEERLVSTSEA